MDINKDDKWEQWQPIETAPKSEDISILVVGGMFETDLSSGTPMVDAVKVFYDEEDTIWRVDNTCYYSCIVTNPTHWHPLPKLPD